MTWVVTDEFDNNTPLVLFVLPRQDPRPSAHHIQNCRLDSRSPSLAVGALADDQHSLVDPRLVTSLNMALCILLRLLDV